FNMMFNANLNINCVKMCLDYVKQRELRINVSSPSVCVINNQLFVITYDGKMYMYNSYEDNWIRKASLPVNTSNIIVRVIDEQIFVICSSEAGWKMFVYNQVKDLWIKKAAPYVLSSNVC
ncbi:MAG: hypothetical protein FWF66_01900, partial [Candidatus Bathyarchaeota archaeon]|nr:hypothetical protein [Candidatus Termiticorpusculum sp.]